PLREAKDLHTALHIGPRALSKACNISMQQAREVVQTCPHCNSAPALEAGVNPRGLGPLQIWQTDFTLEPRMAPRSWLAVTVDTASSAIVVTQHGRVTSVAVQHHWATAIAVLGRPKAIKTDNGSCFTSKSTREWLARWGIAHTTGIPGNSQGQAMVERANRLLKDRIRVLAEGDGFMKRIPTSKQGELLAKAMYALNHFERGENTKTPIQKHWRPTVLTEGPPVKIRIETGEWEKGWNVLVWGRGYAAVKNRDTDKVIWVPSRKVKPDITQKDEVTKKDEASPLFAGISDWIPWEDEQEGLQGETASNKQERPGEDTLAANES
nr:p32 IN [Rous sarcoma virus]